MPVPTEKNPVLFIIDEVAHIGRMQCLEDAITLQRGTGIRVWLFVQSLDQMTKCFGEHAETVLDAISTQQYFALSSLGTADSVSRRLGVATVVGMSQGSNSGRSREYGIKAGGSSYSDGSSIQYSEHERPLLRPEEVLTLPDHLGVVFHRNHAPILVRLIRYYSDKSFRWRRWRGYGTGRERKSAGSAAVILGLLLLPAALGLARFAADLPAPRWERPQAAGRYYRPDAAYDFADDFGGEATPLPTSPWGSPSPYLNR
jgi:type IV secretion system protein VirD4